MAQIEITISMRRPVWFEDYLELVVRLGLDPAEAIRFTVAHFEFSMDDGKTWLPLWATNEPPDASDV